MPSLRVLSVIILVGMGATVAALGGSGESGEPGSELRGGLIARPAATATTAPSATASAGTLSAGTTGASAAAPVTGPGFDVQAENEQAGTPGWRISRSRGTRSGLAGYTAAVSVLPGQPVPLSVSGTGAVRVQAFRIGWYGGVGARRVWQGTLRAEPETGDPGLWPARGLADTTGWPEGHYLLRLDQGEASRYLPLTVRSADNRGRVVVLTSPLTWQAENVPAAPVTKAPAELPKISFDRPYAAGYGSAGFLTNDAAVVQLAERSGERIGFVTDYDVATDPTLLTGAAAVLTGGDSQYWTASLRTAVRAAQAAGTNLAFFGAGTGARQIRLVDEGRALQISRAEPSDSVKITGLRPSCSPASRSSATGPSTDWVVVNSDWWGYKGTKLQTDDVLPDLVAGRVDRSATTAADSPKPMQVLAYTQAPCLGETGTVAQAGVYLVRPSGAGVFTAGTGRWACAITGSCVNPSGPATRFTPDTKQAVVRITLNVIKSFAAAEAGKRLPAQNSASQYAALR